MLVTRLKESNNTLVYKVSNYARTGAAARNRTGDGPHRDGDVISLHSPSNDISNEVPANEIASDRYSSETEFIVMWPWEHLALGYLAVSLAWRLAEKEVNDWIALSVAFGTQFPDLVDKLLAWYFDILPAARSLTHSALVAVPLSIAVLLGTSYHDRPDWGVAFAVGYMSHLFGDALPQLIERDYQSLTFLLWPVLPLPDYEGLGSVLVNVRELIASPSTYLSVGTYRIGIVVALIVLWTADGFPGLIGVRRYLSRTARSHVLD